MAPDVYIDLSSGCYRSQTSESVEPVVSCDALIIAAPFGGQLSSGSAVRSPVKIPRLLFIAIFDCFAFDGKC